jgi:carboxymethylenebutenolidase
MNSGLYSSYEPGVFLNYDFYCQETPTKVELKFERVSAQTRITLSQKNFSDNQDGQDCRAMMAKYWDEMLPHLQTYLDNFAGGYISRPVGNAPFPAVILLHDRFGLNRTSRSLADSLALKGYLALCVDMFKGDVTGDAIQAQRFLTLVNDSESVAAVLKGYRYLKSLSDVAPRKIAVWGLGYGGSMAMKMITAEPSLKACVDWYGSKLPSTDELSRISTPIMCIFASRDAASPGPVITAFNQGLVQAGIRADLVIIAGNEGFADPANAENFNSESLREAWERSLLFIDRRLRL